MPFTEQRKELFYIQESQRTEQAAEDLCLVFFLIRHLNRD